MCRKELRKVIKEKNRLELELKEEEEKQAAGIDLRIRKDVEKIKRQLEEEKLQRIELATRVCKPSFNLSVHALTVEPYKTNL